MDEIENGFDAPQLIKEQDSKQNPFIEKIAQAKQKSQIKRPRKRVIPVDEQPRQILLWGESSRGLNNTIGRSSLFGIGNKTKKRKLMTRAVLFSCGEGVVTYSGPDLRQDDEDVFLQILHLARELNLDRDVVQFSAYQFMKALGWQPNSKNYERLRNIITILAGAVVEIEYEGRLGYGSALIQNYKFESESSEDKNRKWTVKLDRQIVVLFQDTLFTHLDWRLRMRLRRQLSKKLHTFYSTHREPFKIKVETLFNLCRSEAEHMYTFRQELKRALDELKENNFLRDYKIDSNDLVQVTKNMNLGQARQTVEKLVQSN